MEVVQKAALRNIIRFSAVWRGLSGISHLWCAIKTRLEAILWLRTSEFLSFENFRFWQYVFTCLFLNVLAIHRLGEITKSTGNLGMYFSGGLPFHWTSTQAKNLDKKGSRAHECKNIWNVLQSKVKKWIS